MIRETGTIYHLQKSVMKHFGKRISTATDCEQLADELLQKFNANISAQTLRRFFGLIRSTSASGIYTLNLLSKYCNTADFQSFNKLYENSELEAFFGETEENGRDYWRKGEDLCLRISDSSEMLISTHHRLMSFPLVRKYFMESHPMRDMIGTVYSQYFLAYLKFNPDNEAKIFAYGFLFHGAFLQQNTELMDLYHRKVQETELTEEVYVIPAGLKFGVQLLYADFIGDEFLFKKTFNEMKKWRLIYLKGSEKSVCSFEYTVLESLIFTDRINEIQFLLDNNTGQKKSDRSYVPSDRKQTHDEVWKILCTVAYYKLGDQNKARSYMNTVDIENLGIGWRKYYSIMYHFVQVELNECNHKPETIDKLRSLINETYFYYYEDKLDNLTDRFRENF